MSAETSPQARPREQWTGQVGFILSAIGSAIGLGNIWRFPGVAYENGGGAFLLPYLIALLTAGIPILYLDYAIGHRFRGSAPLAFRRISRWFETLGWYQVAICFAIAVYYAAVIAWAASYFWYAFGLQWGDDTTSFFLVDYLQVADVGGADPWFTFDFVPAVLIPLVLVWLVTIAVLSGGVARGVQRVNMLFIPLLLVAFGALVIRSLTLPGALDGLNALFTPDWAALGSTSVWIAAYGQVFFSLSIAFGIMITYASYRKRRANLTSPGLVVAFANSGFEIFAGIGVFAALGFLAGQQGVAFGELEGISGPILSFVTFPALISEMPAGSLFGALFFGSLVMAGFTSLVSILQVVSAGFQDKFGISRQRAALVIGGIAAVISVTGFSTTTGLIALDTLDNWANNIGIVSSAIFMCVLVVWVARRSGELRYHLTSLSTTPVGSWWTFCIGVLAPVVLGWMLVSRIVSLLTEGYEGYASWYLGVVGWGAIAAFVVLSVLLTLMPWKYPVTAYDPWPRYDKGGS